MGNPWEHTRKDAGIAFGFSTPVGTDDGYIRGSLVKAGWASSRVEAWRQYFDALPEGGSEEEYEPSESEESEQAEQEGEAEDGQGGEEQTGREEQGGDEQGGGEEGGEQMEVDGEGSSVA
ncbi:hypothetical protein L226DRAFT_525449 [Lentinus tigrinus ALCF2SS1-7]|uniref:uncharacterized protein n=1 Tax=Lentinus tigrinus ALCF2SS1-7 TaxID=1328758 RepID=UPI001165E52E|nr:hypothetical protein L226DRAFT_525449 [Lentinus tigrinus ALCF2SS1-7]